MSKSKDPFQVSMFDSLPEMVPPQPKSDPDEGVAVEPRGKARQRSKPATPLASDEAFTLENFLPYRLLEVAQGISRRMSKALAEDWDMSLAEWQVLASLAREGAVSVREIEPRTLLDTVAVSRAAKRLTDRKLIKRDVNKQDKRLVVLRTSKKGRDVAAEIGQSVIEMESDFLKGMNVQDRIRLSQLLKSLV
ncbi:DNA-binding transcriptional regulator, MarR family [Cohaesibacter sp. ES.047]|uniref:MarR family winged helix-turn-helix transcriptional regulator n=1 Tax=Cohaesibacter sp. ES.047 TaxID=1798205 RepID=UPI000BB73DBE|nr:MarR family winged helix-turn-helix transcriptional regulator [Cohaesibacter sp. ES.047]SNY93881.1 DNA-binding transcriptional regulator, MarR family [Cohaesibacter sp. ES.047]